LLGILEAVENDSRTRQAITVMQLRCEYVDGLSKELEGAARNQERMARAFEAAYREARKAGSSPTGCHPKSRPPRP
jgi:hypothetical protein